MSFVTLKAGTPRTRTRNVKLGASALVAIAGLTATGCGDDTTAPESVEQNTATTIVAAPPSTAVSAATAAESSGNDVAAATTAVQATTGTDPATTVAETNVEDDRQPFPVPRGAQVEFSLAQAQQESGTSAKKGCVAKNAGGGEYPDGTVATATEQFPDRTRTITYQCKDGKWVAISDVTTRRPNQANVPEPTSPVLRPDVERPKLPPAQANPDGARADDMVVQPPQAETVDE